MTQQKIDLSGVSSMFQGLTQNLQKAASEQNKEPPKWNLIYTCQLPIAGDFITNVQNWARASMLHLTMNNGAEPVLEDCWIESIREEGKSNGSFEGDYAKFCDEKWQTTVEDASKVAQKMLYNSIDSVLFLMENGIFILSRATIDEFYFEVILNSKTEMEKIKKDLQLKDKVEENMGNT